MRIGIDARMLGNTGIGRYLRNLLIQLAKIDTPHEYLILLQPNEPLPIQQDNVIPIHLAGWTPIYSIQEQYRLPLEIRKQRIDLMHYSNFNVPIMPCCPFVVTIHDLIYYLYPEECPSMIAHHYARYMIGYAIKHARAILTVSEHSRKDLNRFFHMSPDKTHVIPNGADEQCQQPEQTNAHESREIELKRRYGIEGRYSFYVGKHHGYKNITTLVQAFMTHQEVCQQTQLVIAGKRDPRRHELYDLAAHLDPGGRIIFTDFVKDDDLFALYRGASLFVFPSLYEGFGLPPLEAMACGVPVICSNAASLPEVVGDAAILVDPLNIREMADAMRSVLTDDCLYRSLQEKGCAQVRRFSWERAARQLLNIYVEYGKNLR